MKIVTIVGARPQFIKAAMVSRAIKKHNSEKKIPFIEEYILHTGQHYDENMSDVFFKTMEIPLPTWILQCSGGSHATMTAQMMVEIEQILNKVQPDYVLVYGDTNSTLAGALTAAKLHIPIIHIEAGLRSFNREMPEEINRVLTDHLSTWLFCPTTLAVEHLTQEGITKSVFHVGDVMYDAALTFGDTAEKKSTILKDLNLQTKSFRLCTIHRAENTDNKERLTGIINALNEIATTKCPIILPIHPRTKVFLEKYGLNNILSNNKSITITPPVDYLSMVLLEKNAQTIFTDSGGVQKEAYFHKTPCITLRDETEWVETILCGWNQLASFQTNKIIECLNNPPLEKTEIAEYGNGDTSDKIISLLSGDKK